MAVTSEIHSNDTQEDTYPKLMRGTGTGIVVLFTTPQAGTIVASPSTDLNLGCHYKTWGVGSFEEFEGSVTLSNK